MRTCLGDFKNYEEMIKVLKEAKISEYKKLVAMSMNSLSMELSDKLFDLADILVNQFGLTRNDIEALEMEVIA
jgi:hypothetical protein|nr:MAG TPA: hypothetical protein [Caudoviricetes sp.]